MIIDIDSIELYLAVRRLPIIEPLTMPQLFNVINRTEIVDYLYPETSTATDSKFYHDVWSMKPHYCENCGLPLKEYSPVFISHIKTRGAHTEIRYDYTNVNVLCFECHNKYEYATLDVKEKMYVCLKNGI